MAYQHYRSQFGDTTFTKVFVGGLAWETPTEEMRKHFEQFGEILEAVIISDKNTGRSKGYGFVTFRDPESARRACIDSNPVIDGRKANCNIASFGRPRPSPPRGRPQGSNPYHGAAIQGGTSHNRLRAPPPQPPPPPPIFYPPYGYTTYTPDYGYPQLQPQYYHQLYGASSTGGVGSPYYYGYSSRGDFSAPQAHGIRGPSYLYYPAQGEVTFTTFPLPAGPVTTGQLVPFSTHSQSLQQTSTTTTGVGVTTSQSPDN